MEQNEIVEILQNESFINSIEQAVPHRTEIMTNLSLDMKELKERFVETMKEYDYDNYSVIDKDDKEGKKEWKKNVLKQFDSMKHLICPNPNEDMIGKIIDKVVSFVKIAKYIGNNELIDRFAEKGIKIECSSLETDYPAFDDDTAKGEIRGVFAELKDIQNDIHDHLDQINIVAFENLDEDIKYSPDNKSGLKKADFAKIVKTKAIKEIKTMDIFMKHIEKECENNQIEIDRNQLLFEYNSNVR